MTVIVGCISWRTALSSGIGVSSERSLPKAPCCQSHRKRWNKAYGCRTPCVLEGKAAKLTGSHSFAGSYNALTTRCSTGQTCQQWSIEFVPVPQNTPGINASTGKSRTSDSTWGVAGWTIAANRWAVMLASKGKPDVTIFREGPSQDGASGDSTHVQNENDGAYGQLIEVARNGSWQPLAVTSNRIAWAYRWRIWLFVLWSLSSFRGELLTNRQAWCVCCSSRVRWASFNSKLNSWPPCRWNSTKREVACMRNGSKSSPIRNHLRIPTQWSLFHHFLLKRKLLMVAYRAYAFPGKVWSALIVCTTGGWGNKYWSTKLWCECYVQWLVARCMVLVTATNVLVPSDRCEHNERKPGIITNQLWVSCTIEP